MDRRLAEDTSGADLGDGTAPPAVNAAARLDAARRERHDLDTLIACLAASQAATGILEQYPDAATLELFASDIDESRWGSFRLFDAHDDPIYDVDDLWERWGELVADIPSAIPVRIVNAGWLSADSRDQFVTVHLHAAANQEIS